MTKNGPLPKKVLIERSDFAFSECMQITERYIVEAEFWLAFGEYQRRTLELQGIPASAQPDSMRAETFRLKLKFIDLALKVEGAKEDLAELRNNLPHDRYSHWRSITLKSRASESARRKLLGLD